MICLIIDKFVIRFITEPAVIAYSIVSRCQTVWLVAVVCM